jgi:hypothetical protein
LLHATSAKTNAHFFMASAESNNHSCQASIRSVEKAPTRGWAIAALVASFACIAHAAAIGFYGALTWFFMGAVAGWIAWIIPATATATAVTMTFVRKGRWKWMAIVAFLLAPIGSAGSCWGGLVARGECERRGTYFVMDCRREWQKE